MIETFTMVMQFVILGGLMFICWRLAFINQMTRDMTIQIAKYRREVDWLTARLDGVQGVKPNGEGVRPQAAEASRAAKAI